MRYKEALWDGSDPSYAPGLSWNGRYAKWKAAQKCVKAGYTLKSYKLPDGSPDDEHQMQRAQTCRELTREMLKWWEGESKTYIDPGTWSYLLKRYITDDLSPFQNVAPVTQQNYKWCINRWEEAIGKVRSDATNYERIMAWEAGMKDNGRSTAYIKRMFTILRIVINYAAMIEQPEAERISGILSRMRVKGTKPRSVYPTRDIVYSIIRTATEAGNHSMALGYVIQFELALSANDVIGRWQKPKEGQDTEGGILDGAGNIWSDGITWADISGDLSTLTKGRNKTGGDPINYDISGIKPLQDMLAQIPKDKRAGPLIISPRTNLPYKAMSWSHGFNKMMKKAGHEGFQNRDLRAGALSEGQMLGASREQLQGLANHKNGNTTEIYMRGGSTLANNVIKLRQGAK